MIVKMTILMFLGSSDDKEKEKIGIARPEEPTHEASVHPMVVGRTDAMTEGNQFMGTGWTDGSKRGIGALGVLCSKDDVKSPGEVSSAPVEPVKHRCIPSV